ncbi:Predicted Zn-dependent peptidase [Jatrophihabitans endophyticus]|uniref:Predicted Zn-dependent peptidase n=1 Tax=Jatrophihabitans endophyticus TaxID=1206085 RepID=A0A1M5MJW0_9ACTN|nr:pitrilysin family protein [Jatrophihabitans endophyticus]SHG77043.1 Predicted Zn-dependent peptidase [Jatrophihabitans endophyticus]
MPSPRAARPLTRATTRRLATATGGGAITRTVLPGGLRVVTETMPGVRSASVGVWVPVGSRDETVALAGTSHFLEHLLFKGTATRSALDIAGVMDDVGGEFNAFTEKEHTCYYATVLDRDVDVALEIVGDVVLNATVAARDVDVERGVVLEEISMRDDDPSDLVHDEFAAALFGDTPLGRPILGTEESIHALTRRQVAGYYRRRYTTDSMVVAVAGNIEHGDVVRHVRRVFGERLDPGAAAQSARPADGDTAGSTARPAEAIRVVADDTEQANLLLGCHGLSRHDPRRYALGVLSSALGGGMSSRLFQRVREERGLAYSVYSYTSAFADAGQFGVYAGCQPGKADEVLSIMLAELDAVAGGALDAAEVERGKGQMRGALVLGLEDTGSRMTRIGKSETAYGDILGLDDVLAEIDAVTPDDVAAVATDVLHRPRCLTVVGPFGEHDFDSAV